MPDCVARDGSTFLFRAKLRHAFDSYLPDITGSKGQDNVPLFGGLPEECDPIGLPVKTGHILVAVMPDAFGQSMMVNPFDYRLAGRIYRHQDQHVGLVERPCKVIEQGVRPGIAMGLKNHDQPPARPALSDSVEGRLDLRGMMAIVVYDLDAPRIALYFESALNALEVLQGELDLFKRDVYLHANGDSGQGVIDVMEPRQVQRDPAQRPAVIIDRKPALNGFKPEIHSLDIGLGV